MPWLGYPFRIINLLNFISVVLSGLKRTPSLSQRFALMIGYRMVSLRFSFLLVRKNFYMTWCFAPSCNIWDGGVILLLTLRFAMLLILHIVYRFRCRNLKCSYLRACLVVYYVWIVYHIYFGLVWITLTTENRPLVFICLIPKDNPARLSVKP